MPAIVFNDVVQAVFQVSWLEGDIDVRSALVSNDKVHPIVTVHISSRQESGFW